MSDNSILRELLHPEKTGLQIRYRVGCDESHHFDCLFSYSSPSTRDTLHKIRDTKVFDGNCGFWFGHIGKGACGKDVCFYYCKRYNKVVGYAIDWELKRLPV